MGQEFALEVRNVSKVFETAEGETHAVENCSLATQAGEFVCILGPSGCGKTTLLRIAAGLIPPTSGEVLFEGRRITGPPPDIGMVFQRPVLLPWRNSLENVLLPIEFLGKDARELRGRAREMLELVGLADFERRYPYELSGGMQQRVAISRALIHDPKVLLMDEPFGALDAMTRDVMNLELQRIWLERRKTVLFVTHSIDEAVFLADRVIMMSRRPGRILEEIPVRIPRPRNLEDRFSPQFGEAAMRARECVYGGRNAELGYRTEDAGKEATP
jgi:NitT/TauT family transport system ATP-binding protein